MRDQLHELDPAQVRVNQPLQWDVFSAQGGRPEAEVRSAGPRLLMGTAGMPLGEPVPRDTTLPKFAIDAIVGKGRVMVLVDPGRLFGAG